VLNRLKALLAGPSGPEPPTPESRGRHAVAALMLALARSDDDYSSAEREAVRLILERDLEVPSDEVDGLLAEADEARAASIDLWSFTHSVREEWNREERFGILVMLWRVALADGRLAGREDHLMHRLGDLLGFSQRELIRAKQDAKGPRPR
jgi:uncharacterized tellurite resistance protein B-like protein